MFINLLVLKVYVFVVRCLDAEGSCENGTGITAALLRSRCSSETWRKRRDELKRGG